VFPGREITEGTEFTTEERGKRGRTEKKVLRSVLAIVSPTGRIGAPYLRSSSFSPFLRCELRCLRLLRSLLTHSLQHKCDNSIAARAGKGEDVTGRNIDIARECRAEKCPCSEKASANGCR